MIAHFLWERAEPGAGEDELPSAAQEALAEAEDGLQRNSLSANQRKLVKVIAAGHDHPLRKAWLEQADLVKSSAVDARDSLAAQGDLFILDRGRVALSDPFLASWGLTSPACPSGRPRPCCSGERREHGKPRRSPAR